MRILMLDNYDSFTFNLVQMLRELQVEHDVIRNDKISAPEAAVYDKIIFSPGPGLPGESGAMMEIIDHCHQNTPMLGICLGHQALAEYFGAELRNLEEVFHGVKSPIIKKKFSLILQGMEDEFDAGRYHSWVVQKNNLPDKLLVTTEDENGQIMSLEHEDLPLFGVQFHPESIMTPHGINIINNFLNC